MRDVAGDISISEQTVYSWRRQERVDQGIEPGVTSAEGAELAAARRRIRELEAGLAIHSHAAELLKGTTSPRRFAAVEVIAAYGLPVLRACLVLNVSESGYYARRSRAPSAQAIRHIWLTDVIRQVPPAMLYIEPITDLESAEDAKVLQDPLSWFKGEVWRCPYCWSS